MNNKKSLYSCKGLLSQLMKDTCVFVPKIYSSELFFFNTKEDSSLNFYLIFPHQVQLCVVSASFCRASVYL